MAIVTTDDTHYKMIADEIRLATGETDTYKPSEMWLGVNRVYASGLTQGEEFGIEIGIERGKQELLELHPEVTVSGSYISVDGVSEFSHEVKCKVSGVDDPTSVTVTKCGRNLLNPNTLGSGEIVEYNGVPCYKYIDKNVDTGNWKIIGCFKENTQYTITIKQYRLETASISNWQYVIVHTDGSSVYAKQTPSGESLTLTSTAGKTVAYIYSPSYGWDTLYLDLSVSCLNEGVAALPYEPYNGQTLTPNADGTVEGMTSVSPYMNIFTDNVGVTLEATYRKSAGFDVGKQAEYDRLWDAIQTNGERVAYQYAFREGWNDSNFKPKYDMKPVRAEFMFVQSKIENLSACLKEQGRTLDTSNATNVTAMFQLCERLKKVPKIDLSSVTGTGANQLFNSSQLIEEVEEIVFNSEITSTASTFNWCTSLKRLKISGEIACSVDVGHSPLDAESLVSVVEHYSTTKTGLTLTVKQSAVNNADWSKTNYASWDELKAIRPNLGFAYK